MKNKNLYFVAAIMCLLSLSIYLLPSTSLARMMPGAITYKGTGDLAPVTFSHAVHLSYGTACNDCHSKVFEKKSGAAGRKMTMKTMEEGKYCGTCHNGEYAFSIKVKTDCQRCHVK